MHKHSVTFCTSGEENIQNPNQSQGLGGENRTPPRAVVPVPPIPAIHTKHSKGSWTAVKTGGLVLPIARAEIVLSVQFQNA